MNKVNQLQISVINLENNKVEKYWSGADCAFIYTEEKVPNNKLLADMWMRNMSPESFKVMIETILKDKDLRRAMSEAVERYYKNPTPINTISGNINHD